MEDNFEIAKRIKPTMMKSSTQTYDIRDSEEFKGVFEIEVAIQAETNKRDIQHKIAQKLRDIFRQKKKVGNKNKRIIKGNKNKMDPKQ